MFDGKPNHIDIKQWSTDVTLGAVWDVLRRRSELRHQHQRRGGQPGAHRLPHIRAKRGLNGVYNHGQQPEGACIWYLLYNFQIAPQIFFLSHTFLSIPYSDIFIHVYRYTKEVIHRGHCSVTFAGIPSLEWYTLAVTMLIWFLRRLPLVLVDST